MDIEVRKAISSDYSGICSLINHELGYPDITLEELSERLDAMKNAGNYYTFVAVCKDSIVGFIGITKGMAYEISGEYYRILAFAVSSKYQNKGIGSLILRYVENFASQNGISYFTLSSGMQRTEAHVFYERNGYKKMSYSFSKGSKHHM